MGGPCGFYIVPFLFYHAGNPGARTFATIRGFGVRRNATGNKPLMVAIKYWKSLPVLPTFRVLHPYGGKSRNRGDARPHCGARARLELPIMDEILKAKRQQAGS